MTTIDILIQKYIDDYRKNAKYGMWVSLYRYCEERDDSQEALQLLQRERQSPAEPLLQVASRLISDSVKSMLPPLHGNSGIVVLDRRTAQLNAIIDDYVESAWTAINDFQKPLTLQYFARKFPSNGVSGTAMVSYFLYNHPKEQADAVLFSHLTKEHQKAVKPIPKNLDQMYRYFINKYLPRYVQFAPQAMIKYNYRFSLQKFFLDMDPDKPFDESDQGSRNGQLNKIVTFFTQHKHQHGFDDFDEWVMSQIDSPIVLDWVKYVPKTGNQRHGYLISRDIGKYETYAAYNMFYKLHVAAPGIFRATLTPIKFIGQTDFSKKLNGQNIFTRSNQKGTYGKAVGYHMNLNRKAKQKGQPITQFTDWLASVIWPEKRHNFLRITEFMTSKDPAVQGEAMKVFYPQYMDLCDIHRIPISDRMLPEQFAQKVFPELYKTGGV